MLIQNKQITIDTNAEEIRAYAEVVLDQEEMGAIKDIAVQEIDKLISEVEGAMQQRQWTFGAQSKFNHMYTMCVNMIELRVFFIRNAQPVAPPPAALPPVTFQNEIPHPN
jgi:hypothetical protein